MAQIVLIEDDVDIRRLVADALAAQGHDVESAAAALEGLQLTVKGKPDLVVMDLGLPDLDGTELLRMIRAVSQVPIIVITARGADEVVVRTLDSGADDYLVKPFSVAQLEARVRALLRRGAATDSGETIRIGDLIIDQAAREATLAGEPIDLSPKEFDLLRVLAERVGEVVSKRALMAESGESRMEELSGRSTSISPGSAASSARQRRSHAISAQSMGSGSNWSIRQGETTARPPQPGDHGAGSPSPSHPARSPGSATSR